MRRIWQTPEPTSNARPAKAALRSRSSFVIPAPPRAGGERGLFPQSLRLALAPLLLLLLELEQSSHRCADLAVDGARRGPREAGLHRAQHVGELGGVRRP